MNKDAVIWDRDVYQNDFKCAVCNVKLGENGAPYDTLPFTPLGRFYACPVCFQPVAVEQTVDVSEDESGLQGDYKDYLKKRAKLKRRLRK